MTLLEQEQDIVQVLGRFRQPCCRAYRCAVHYEDYALQMRGRGERGIGVVTELAVAGRVEE